MTRKIVQVGDRSIEFELYRKKVKNINLRIKSDLTVMVSAPHRVPYRYIEEFVLQKSSWIFNKLERLRNLPKYTNLKYYNSGETVLFLGKERSLQVREVGEKKKEGVVLEEEEIFMYVKDPEDCYHKERLFNNWLKEQATPIFQESLERMYPLVQTLGVPKPIIRTRKMKIRWGSCSVHKQSLNLNTALLQAPRRCIDYVVLHELIHFRHLYHDSYFYSLLDELMPEWKEHKKFLHTHIRCDM